MNRRFVTITTTIAALAALAACDVSTDPVETLTGGRVLIVNGAKDAGSIRIYVDNVFLGQLALGTVGSIRQVTGSHVVEVQRGDGTPGFSRQVTLDSTATASFVVFDSAGVLTPAVLSDTNALVPAGATKLRVAHFAATAGPIDIWRTQPDFPTPTRVQFPFAFQVTSPYLQSTPGDWRVLVSDTVPAATPGAPMPDTLAMSPLIPIPDGLSRTIVVVDKLPSGVSFVLLDP